jgi:hypothetical protein
MKTVVILKSEQATGLIHEDGYEIKEHEVDLDV